MSSEQPVVKRLKTRVRSLHSELAESVPKVELETLKATLETKMGDFEAELGQSVRKEEADSLRVRLEELESRLAESIPKRDAEAELESVKSKLEGEIEQLERKLAGSGSIVDPLRADLAQLQGRLAESISKAESEAKVKELETKLSDARRDFEEKFSQSSAKIEELQVEVSNSIRSEADELRARVAQLEGALSRTVSKADAEALVDKANRLEASLTEAREKLNSVETRSRNLEFWLDKPKGDVDVLKEKLARASRCLMNYVKAWLNLYVFYYDLIRRQ